jgi:hypothetical protein
MNTNRKIQLAAAAVIANGALALGLLSPSSARAAGCGVKYVCVTGTINFCIADTGAACVEATPPGCTISGQVCEGECGVGKVEAACLYVTS